MTICRRQQRRSLTLGSCSLSFYSQTSRFSHSERAVLRDCDAMHNLYLLIHHGGAPRHDSPRQSPRDVSGGRRLDSGFSKPTSKPFLSASPANSQLLGGSWPLTLPPPCPQGCHLLTSSLFTSLETPHLSPPSSQRSAQHPSHLPTDQDLAVCSSPRLHPCAPPALWSSHLSAPGLGVWYSAPRCC